METTEIYTLSLHDALPIYIPRMEELRPTLVRRGATLGANCTILCGTTIGTGAHEGAGADRDRKSTRLNSSHVKNSYAVFCLKKKKKSIKYTHRTHVTDTLT